MFNDLNKINKGFKKGFKSVYYAKVRCPVCKEVIYANALKCPYCTTDLTKGIYKSRTKWQGGAMRILLMFSILIGVIICLSGAPVVVGILAILVLYGAGNIVIQKIQSFRNYHNK
ncbi:MAG TPA: hypothetical protein VK483_01355 [Chitinophagaceae bacterium]|nr:hypothetical protein [Chitinophagaceae bacterium]